MVDPAGFTGMMPPDSVASLKSQYTISGPCMISALICPLMGLKTTPPVVRAIPSKLVNDLVSDTIFVDRPEEVVMSTLTSSSLISYADARPKRATAVAKIEVFMVLYLYF